MKGAFRHFGFPYHFTYNYYVIVVTASHLFHMLASLVPPKNFSAEYTNSTKYGCRRPVCCPGHPIINHRSFPIIIILECQSFKESVISIPAGLMLLMQFSNQQLKNTTYSIIQLIMKVHWSPIFLVVLFRECHHT